MYGLPKIERVEPVIPVCFKVFLPYVLLVFLYVGRLSHNLRV